MDETFEQWLAREMPTGTVISDPAWWAPKIVRAVLRGFERSKEPVAVLLPEDSINDIQAESIKQLISRAKHAHYVDVKIRINGQDEHYQADWLKHLQLSAPPAASGTVQVPSDEEIMRRIDFDNPGITRVHEISDDKWKAITIFQGDEALLQTIKAAMLAAAPKGGE